MSHLLISIDVILKSSFKVFSRYVGLGTLQQFIAIVALATKLFHKLNQIYGCTRLHTVAIIDRDVISHDTFMNIHKLKHS